jgi:hypothetical protein
MTVSTMQCPHCGAVNPAGSAFCQSCGKAMPTAYQTGPRVVGANEFAATAAGQKLQSDELRKQAKKASGALLAVAIIQTAATAIIFAIIQSSSNPSAPLIINKTVVAIMGALAAIFWALWFWSRVSPLPAAIVGLVLYGTIVVINVVMTVSQMSETGGRGTGIGGIGIGWLDILIIAVLVQGIQAGAKHRKLLQQQTRM